MSTSRLSPKIWGYLPNYDRDAAWSSVEAHGDLLAGVSLFQYGLNADGSLGEYAGLGREPLWTSRRKIAVVPMVTNLVGERWDRDLVADVLADPDRRRHHIEQLIALVVQGRYPALELDYENLAAPDRLPLAGFIEELGQALHERGKELSLALHAKLDEPGEWAGAQAQDWSMLGSVADRIVVMTYDYDPSRPGPIAPIEWTRAVLRFALSQIPSGRVLQGIPFYGYDWSGSGPAEYRTYGDVLALARVHAAKSRREEADQHLVLSYQEAGVAHEVWIPDGGTVSALLNIGRELGVAGYAIWRMGGEDPSAWQAIERIVSPG